MILVTRKEAKLREPRQRVTGQLNDESTLHWNGPTVTLGGRPTWDHGYCASLVRGVQNFHMDSRGWSDIAYNFIECPHGYTFEGRGLNVVNGANGTAAGNRTSHAILCLAGAGNPFSEIEKAAIKGCVRYISSNTNAPPRCKGHRDHKATECPGAARYLWLKQGMPSFSEPVSTNKKDVSMEAALALIKIHYRNARGADYDVEKRDPSGWQHWLSLLLDAYDKGTPLKSVTDTLGAQLYAELQKK